MTEPPGGDPPEIRVHIPVMHAEGGKLRVEWTDGEPGEHDQVLMSTQIFELIIAKFNTVAGLTRATQALDYLGVNPVPQPPRPAPGTTPIIPPV